MILIFGEIISDLETTSFGFEKKLIIAKNTGLFKKDGRKKAKKHDQSIKSKLLEYLKENFEYIKDSVILVFVEDEADKGELLDFINKNGIVCNFEYQKPAQIQARIKIMTILINLSI